MDDFEWIEKDELVEKRPDDDVVRAPKPSHEPGAVSGQAHDMPTEEQELTAPGEVAQEDKLAEEVAVNEVPLHPSVLSAAAQRRKLSRQGFCSFRQV